MPKDPNESRTQMPIRVPDGLYDALKGRAAFDGRSMNQVVIEALMNFLTRPDEIDLAEAA